MIISWRNVAMDSFLIQLVRKYLRDVLTFSVRIIIKMLFQPHLKNQSL